MNCPNCGRELMEGEVCNCTETAEVVNTPPQQENVEQPQQPNFYQPPQPEQPNFYQPPQPEQPQQNYYQPPQDPNGFQPPVAPVMPMPVMEMPARTDYPENYKIKKKYVAVILAVWLGALGIHNFYLGDNTKGIIKILLTTVGALLAIGPLVSLIWAIVEAVMLLTEKTDRDSNGFKIQTFEEALVAQRMKAEAEAAEKSE